MNCKAFAVIAAIGLGIGLAWTFLPSDESSTLSSPNLTSSDIRPPDTSRQKPNLAVQWTAKCMVKESDSLVPRRPLYSYESSVERRESAYLAATRSPEKAMEKALGGDADSAVALFSVARSCYPQGIKQTGNSGQQPLPSTSKECPRLPQDLIQNPFKLLDEAARRGSPTAQFVYAINAVGLSRSLRETNTNESVALAAELIKHAEEYGRLAATSGLTEAYSFMSRSYLVGSFGYRSPELAYAFALPVAANNPSVYQKPVDNLGNGLTSVQKSNARMRALGCSTKSSGNPIPNPFE